MRRWARDFSGVTFLFGLCFGWTQGYTPWEEIFWIGPIGIMRRVRS